MGYILPSLSIRSLTLEGLSLYMSLMCGQLKFPKSSILLWLLANNRVLTRDNLAKRQEVTEQKVSLL
jgi:hypothetical protein